MAVVRIFKPGHSFEISIQGALADRQCRAMVEVNSCNAAIAGNFTAGHGELFSAQAIYGPIKDGRAMCGRGAAIPGDESLAATIRKQIRQPENGRYLRSLPAFAVSE